MDRARRMWVRLGGLKLCLYLYLFHQTHRGPKIAFVTRYYTIAADREFRGRVLEQPYTLHPGWILELRQGADGSQIWYHFRSLYEFVRSFEHARVSEEDARENVEVAIDVAIELMRDLLAFWPLTSGQRRRLTGKLADLRKRFARARRPVLREAHARVEATAGFRDKRERPNPSASAARISAAGRRYTVRLHEITSIAPNVSRLHVIAAQELARIHHVLLERDLAILREVRMFLARCTEERHLRWIVSCLRQVREDLGTIRVAPFYRNARYLEAEIGKVLTVLLDQSQPPSQRTQAIDATLRTMISSIAFKRAQRELESLIREVSMALAARGGSLTASACEQFARRVKEYARRARGLNEDGFKHKRLDALQVKLARAVELLREREVKEAKMRLKEVSALL